MKKLCSLNKLLAACLSIVIAGGYLTYSDINIDKNNIISYADEKDENYSDKLDELQKQQTELDSQIKNAESMISKEKDNISAIEQKYNALQKKVKSIEKSSAELENKMADIDSKMRDTIHLLEIQDKAVKQTQKDFMKRLRSMYVAGGISGYTNVLIDSEDFYDILMRAELVKRVAKHDNDELDKLLEQKAQLEKTQAKLKKQSDDLQKTASDYSKKQKELTDEQKELMQMQKDAAQKLKDLKNNKDDLSDKSKKAAEEYNKISSMAATTTTTTTKAKTSHDNHSDNEQNHAKTTTTVSGRNDNEQTTTKQSHTQTQQPARTTQRPAQTTQRPVQTTPKPATTTPKPTTTTPPAPSYNQSSADIVVNYAKSMVGGRYVWGGSSYRATDCSGLVMLSYQQVGINLPHHAATQANYGSVVSYNNMMPGDLIFFGSSSYSSIYHVAIYIGGGRMVHAENSYTGIVISDVASFSRYNHITVIKRIL